MRSFATSLPPSPDMSFSIVVTVHLSIGAYEIRARSSGFRFELEKCGARQPMRGGAQPGRGDA